MVHINFVATPMPTKNWRVSLWQILAGLRAEILIAQVREVLGEMDTSTRCGGSMHPHAAHAAD